MSRRARCQCQQEPQESKALQSTKLWHKRSSGRVLDLSSSVILAKSNIFEGLVECEDVTVFVE